MGERDLGTPLPTPHTPSPPPFLVFPLRVTPQPSSLSFSTNTITNTASKKDDPKLAEKRESAKQDSVQKAQKGSPEWKESLASDSEENVKGEKSDMDMEEMKRMAEKKGEEENK